jgi:hypothetical protein
LKSHVRLARLPGTIEFIAKFPAKNYNQAIMRIIARCLFFAVVGVLLVPSSQDLRSRYGEPDLERFVARPGIALTVEYGSDHLACQALIEPPRPLIYADEHAAFMPPETVTEILEEIAPASERGIDLLRSISSMGCNESRSVEYENVTIVRETHNCLPLMPEREMQATVAFKRDICRRSK